MIQTYKFLHFIKNSIFFLWDPKRLSLSALKYRYNTIPLKDVLSVPKMEWIDIEDDKDYPILGVHAQGEGVYINRIAKGKELTMKQYQRSKPMHLFYCKVRTVNGQWGIVYPEFSNSYGSSNMQYLSISQEKLNPSFLELLLRVKSITQEWDKNAVGADGRHFPLKTLLNLQIPLPSLEEQNKIVAAYNATIAQADNFSEQANDINEQIEVYLKETLGIGTQTSSISVSPYRFMSIYHYREITNRWDVNNVRASYDGKYQFKNMADIIIGMSTGTTPPTRNKEYFDGDIDFYSPSDINGDMYLGDAERHISVNAVDDKKARLFNKGDLLFVGIGSTVGKVGLVAKEKVSSNQQITGIIFNTKKVLPEYAFVYMHYFKENTTADQSKTTLPIVNQEKIAQIQIPLPPLAIQNEIVNHITALRAEQKNLQQQASELRLQAQQQFEQTIFE